VRVGPRVRKGDRCGQMLPRLNSESGQGQRVSLPERKTVAKEGVCRIQSAQGGHRSGQMPPRPISEDGQQGVSRLQSAKGGHRIEQMSPRSVFEGGKDPTD